MATIHDILNNAVNLPLKYRGRWQPTLGALPNLSVYPNGSLLIASDTGIISGATYLQNSILINAQGSWVVANNNPVVTQAPIEYLDIEAGDNLDDFDGVRNAEFIYQILTVSQDVVGSVGNVPLDPFLGGLAGVCEVFGDINVQRYTTLAGRLFSRLVGSENEPWTEISVDLTAIETNYELLIESLMNIYSLSGIESDSGGGGGPL